ncbi:uncharacterized protein LOC114320490 isoform X1 [Camellia sinensis]|uniref:uncharacterized protein LOC114320490 isoform X1 n=1 Tax=Camellia sinensis TaxID=4442 RepID=UPI001035DD75|nr:uncharacterized protein LOC114320490 isoform X1 [Camellia sinensis]
MATMAILLGPRKRKARRNGGRSEVGRVGPKISESSSSSSSSSSPPHVQSVCFRGKSIENDMIEWFHFTMAGSDSNKKERRRRCRRGQVNLVFHHNHRHKGEGEHSRILSPIQIQPPDSSSDASPAALGSIIYCIGGRRFRNCGHDDDHTRQVHYFDANHPTEGWKEASPMINRRSEAKVVALHGKLYVFGGGSDCGGDWAEVFEPCGPDDDGGGQGGQWTALPSPPSLPTHGYGCLFAVARKASNKIVVGLQSVVGLRQSVVAYEYDVAHNSWLDFKLNPSLFTLSQPVLVGNMLYWVDYELNAYNLDNKMLFSGPIEDLQIQDHLSCDDYLFTSSLFHLAEDRFCLLWVFPNGSLPRLHCTILQVSKGTDINGKGCLSASVLSCQSFIVEFPLDFLDGLLL